MNQNKTIEIFCKLSREQMQRLRDFVASPYLNGNESLLVLFDYLHAAYPHFSQEQMEDAGIIKATGLKCSAGELRNKMTRLLHLTEDFLAFEYNRNPALLKISTLQAYKKLRLSGHFDSLVAKLQKEFNKEPYKDFNYLWRKCCFEDELIEGFKYKIQRTADRTLAPAIESLDHFHAVRKLRYMVDQANLKVQLGNPYADQFKQETLDFISKADLSDPYIAAYSRIYLFLVEEDETKADSYYYALKKIIQKIKNTFPKAEIRALTSYLEIYAAKRANKGNNPFLSEFLEIIRFKIDQKILLQEGELSPLNYKNIITCALRLGEFVWTERFIEEYTPKIPADYQEDYYNYNMAQLKYFQGKQHEAMDYLKHVSHGKLDIMFSFAVRKLLLRVQVEAGTTTTVQEQIDAYKKHLLRKKKDVGGYAGMLEMFITFLEKLFRADPVQREKTLNELETAGNFTEKEWLLRMVKEKKL